MRLHFFRSKCATMRSIQHIKLFNLDIYAVWRKYFPVYLLRRKIKCNQCFRSQSKPIYIPLKITRNINWLRNDVNMAKWHHSRRSIKQSGIYMVNISIYIHHAPYRQRPKQSLPHLVFWGWSSREWCKVKGWRKWVQRSVLVGFVDRPRWNDFWTR